MARYGVLVVDDDTVAAAAVVAQLDALGHGVIGGVTSGADALALCAKAQPDLALVAQRLGGDVSATHLASQLLRLGPVPSVFIVRDTSATALAALAEARPMGYLAEPFTPAELQLTIDIAMQQATALQRAQEPDDRFFAITIDLLCFLDFNGYFRRLNPAWERTLGYSLAELMSKPFIEFVHPDDRERTLAQNRAVRSGGQALGFENRYRCKDGSYRWFRWNAAPDSGQRVIYSVARDITEARQVEAERERLVSELQDALAEVRELREIVPICSFCKKVRDDENFWHHVETYLAAHTGAQISHGVCPSCLTTEFGMRPEDLEPPRGP